MKKINYFFEKSHLLLVYVVMSFVVFFIFFSMLHFLGNDLGGSGWIVTMKFSLIMGAIISLPVTAMISSGRKNTKFWDEAKIVEDKIEEAETKDKLRVLYDEDVKKLSNMAFGHPQYAEIKKFRAIILTKAKYVKEA